MILKSLCDYYDQNKGLPAQGLQYVKIGYLIVIDENGRFVRINSRMMDKKTAPSFLVLHDVSRSGTKFLPNYFWDNYEYLIGGEDGNDKKHKSFVDMVIAFAEQLPNNKYVNAVARFYKQNKNVENTISADCTFVELKKTKKNISFLIEGEQKIVAEDTEIWNVVLKKDESNVNKQICLVTGEEDAIAETHPKIKFGKDQAPLVSFQKNRGYNSYGKQQGYNAPIGKKAAFAYTTALNNMLDVDSKHNFRLGTRTFVFWTSSHDATTIQMENALYDLFCFADSENIDSNIVQVRKVFEAIYKGNNIPNNNDKFYILGLSSNKGRMVVNYWSEMTLQDFAANIYRYFEDMEIVPDLFRTQAYYKGLKNMLKALVREEKDRALEELAPNMPETLMNSIFKGTPFPYTLLSTCIRRIRADCTKSNTVSTSRVAIIKAYLNRLNNNEIKIMLDKKNINSGYLCGRLFAILEELQYVANRQDSIRSSYMNAASSTPSAIFPTILKLSNSHYNKLLKDKRGIANYFDRQKKEIMALMQDFPDTLNLSDQGRFFLGYYHQKNYKEEKENKE